MTDIILKNTPKDYSVYVHFPFCKARCAYCAFCSSTDFSKVEQYFDRLVAEVEGFLLPAEGKAVTMYWGGGTPSCLPIACLERAYRAIAEKLPLNLSEFTVECNPESADRDKLCFFKDIGVNRLSIGLQSVNDDTLKKIGRLHSYKQFLQTVEAALATGFDNMSADLILGLPETRDMFLRSVEQVSALPLSHVSVYALELAKENSPLARQVAAYGYSDDDLADMYDACVQMLEKKEFLRYEISNFAKRGRECRHNLCYWQERRYCAFGASASGFMGNVRYSNASTLQGYLDGQPPFCEEISPREQAKEFVMLALRLTRGFALEEFSLRFGADFFETFPNAEGLLAQGFLQMAVGRVFIPASKFYVSNSVLAELL